MHDDDDGGGVMYIYPSIYRRTNILTYYNIVGGHEETCFGFENKNDKNTTKKKLCSYKSLKGFSVKWLNYFLFSVVN